jgi:hypothetical protein
MNRDMGLTGVPTKKAQMEVGTCVEHMSPFYVGRGPVRGA